jgi:hypothetical protein
MYLHLMIACFDYVECDWLSCLQLNVSWVGLLGSLIFGLHIT